MKERKSTSVWTILLDEFRSPLILLLLLAAAVLFGVAIFGGEPGELIDASLITLIVLFNAGLGFTQNYRADRGIEALQKLSAQHCLVIRDGKPEVIPATELVSGDVVQLEEGDHVPADGRLLSAAGLVIDESALTGESTSARKSNEAVEAGVVLAERRSMAFMGTIVMGGRGRLLVTATGMGTEVGEIATQVQSVEQEPTQFQREVARLGVRIGWVVAFLVVITAATQFLTADLEPLEVMIAAVALAVAAIPEGLPVVLTLALAFGTRVMLERKALVRSLPVVEIIGSANVICSDKTGTITQGRMTARFLATRDGQLPLADDDVGSLATLMDAKLPFRLAVLVSGLCNNARPHPELGYVGDPTEIALMELADKTGIDLAAYERIEEIPFSSERRMMSVAVKGPNGVELLTKGALEAILPLCASVYAGDRVEPMSEEARDALVKLNEGLANRALRVLALARRTDPPHPIEDSEAYLEFIAMVGMSDPPRPEAKEALATTHEAGIRVVMITGDNAVTAAAIAHDVGLEGEVTEASVLDGMSVEQVAELIRTHSVFARAEPRHKVTILRGLKASEGIVVMTGDGVNDAPALKNADVGIAMGIRGTDVARDASEMVLMDDNFATIVSAVGEGRRILRNIKKFVTYLLAGNLAEVAVIFIGSLFGYLPLSAVQILWVNLVTDSGPAIALGIDPSTRDEMKHPPRHGAFLSRPMVAFIASAGAVATAVILGSFFFALDRWDIDTARSVAFTSLVFIEYVKLAVLRLQEGTSLLANRWLLGAVAASLALHMGILYTPVNRAFGVVPLGPGEWLVVGVGSVVGFVMAMSLAVLIRRRWGAF